MANVRKGDTVKVEAGHVVRLEPINIAKEFRHLVKSTGSEFYAAVSTIPFEDTGQFTVNVTDLVICTKEGNDDIFIVNKNYLNINTLEAMKAKKDENNTKKD